MSTHGKRYRAVREQIDREQAYSPLEAVRLLKTGEGAKFDETVEAHFRLGLNVRHADQQLRGVGRNERIVLVELGLAIEA